MIHKNKVAVNYCLTNSAVRLHGGVLGGAYEPSNSYIYEPVAGRVEVASVLE